MRALIFSICVAGLIVLALVRWARRHFERARSAWVAYEIPMTVVSEGIAYAQDGEVRFNGDGSVLFEGSNVGFEDGVAIDHREAYGLHAWREPGIEKILYLQRPDGIVECRVYSQFTWYRLVPSEARATGLIEEIRRELTHRGPAALVTIPQDFIRWALAIPGFVFTAIANLALIVFILGLLFGQVYPLFVDDRAPEPAPVFRRAESGAKPALITPEVAEFVGCSNFAHDGKLVIAGGPYVSLWDIRSMARIVSEEMPGNLPMITHVAASPTSESVAVVAETNLFLWRRGKGWMSRPDASTAATAPNNWVASAPVWDVRPAIRRDSRSVHTAVFSPDGRLLAAAGSDNTVGTAYLLRANDLAEIVRLTTRGPVVSVAFSADSKLLAAATCEERVVVWEVLTGKRAATLVSPFGPNGAGRPGRLVAFSPAEATLLATASQDGLVHFLDIQSGAHIGSIDLVYSPKCLSFSPDGALLCVLVPGGHYGKLHVLDVKTRKVVKTLTPHVRSDAACFSPSGEFIAVAGIKRVQILRLAEILSQATSTNRGG